MFVTCGLRQINLASEENFQDITRDQGRVILQKQSEVPKCKILELFGPVFRGRFSGSIFEEKVGRGEFDIYTRGTGHCHSRRLRLWRPQSQGPALPEFKYPTTRPPSHGMLWVLLPVRLTSRRREQRRQLRPHAWWRSPSLQDPRWFGGRKT